MSPTLSDMNSRQPSSSLQHPLINQSPFIPKRPNQIPSRVIPTPVIIQPKVTNLPSQNPSRLVPNPSTIPPIPTPKPNNTPKVPTRAQILSKDLSNKPPPAPSLSEVYSNSREDMPEIPSEQNPYPDRVISKKSQVAFKVLKGLTYE